MNQRWHLELLGHFQVNAIAPACVLPRFATRKARVLLACLALRQTEISRAEIAALLWSDSDTPDALRSLSMALGALRKVFGNSIQANNHIISLAPGCFTTDVAAFEAALQKARRLPDRDAPIAALQDAVALYRGAFLPGYAEIKAEAAEWIANESRRLELLCWTALRRLARLLEQRESWDEALFYAWEAHALAPYDAETQAQIARLATNGAKRDAPAPPSVPDPAALFLSDPPAQARRLLALARQAHDDFLPDRNAAYRERLTPEQATFDVALNWTLTEANDPDTGLALALALQEYWYQTNRRERLRCWLEAALLHQARFSAVQCLELRLALARVLLADYQHAEAFAVCQQALPHAQIIGDTEKIVRGFNALGLAAHHAAQDEAARTAFETGFALLPAENGSLDLRGRFLMDFAIALEVQGEPKRAQTLYEESLRLADQIQDVAMQASARFHLADLLHGQGDYGWARHYANESLALRETLKAPLESADCLRLLGALHRDQNHFAEAKFLLERSAEIYAEFGKDECRAAALGILGDVEYRQGHFEVATVFYAEGLDIWRRGTNRRWRAQFLLRSAWVAWRQGDRELASCQYQEAADTCPAIHALRIQSGILRLQAYLALQSGDVSAAHSLATESLEMCKRHGEGLETVTAKEALAEILFEQGRHGEASGMFLQAEARRQEMGTPPPPVGQERYLILLAKARIKPPDARFQNGRGSPTTLTSIERKTAFDQSL